MVHARVGKLKLVYVSLSQIFALDGSWIFSTPQEVMSALLGHLEQASGCS